MSLLAYQIIVFFQFLRRDFASYKAQLGNYVINYSLLQPLQYAVLTGYLQANTYFGSNNTAQNTLLFVGTITVPFLVITFMLAIEILFDLENTRYIDYQITLLNPFLVLVERVVFYSLMTFMMVLPFYPVSKLLLGNYIDMSNTNWFAVIPLLYCGSLCCSAYHVMAACFMKTAAQSPSWWKRANAPLIDLGGMWIPWIVIYNYSHTLGYLAYCNPIIYITDGLKQAIIGGPEFFSLWLCIPMLFFFTIVFTLLAWHFFKKRTDCL